MSESVAGMYLQYNSQLFRYFVGGGIECKYFMRTAKFYMGLSKLENS